MRLRNGNPCNLAPACRTCPDIRRFYDRSEVKSDEPTGADDLLFFDSLWIGANRHALLPAAHGGANDGQEGSPQASTLLSLTLFHVSILSTTRVLTQEGHQPWPPTFD